MPPQFVKSYVKSNKNDANDAKAICEAMSRPNMRFVSVKTIEQQDIQAVHRVRFELSNQRKAKAIQVRGLVAEHGLVAPKELLSLRAAIPDWRRTPRMVSPIDSGACSMARGMTCRRWING